ncbi:hypothetical protein B0H13DRAFT_2263094 [Mycena leptocephala]|nr:hypothetical protein B0H13DRAFT_2263094 [Mycena leptocephala]
MGVVNIDVGGGPELVGADTELLALILPPLLLAPLLALALALTERDRVQRERVGGKGCMREEKKEGHYIVYTPLWRATEYCRALQKKSGFADAWRPTRENSTHSDRSGISAPGNERHSRKDIRCDYVLNVLRINNGCGGGRRRVGGPQQAKKVVSGWSNPEISPIRRKSTRAGMMRAGRAGRS